MAAILKAETTNLLSPVFGSGYRLNLWHPHNRGLVFWALLNERNGNDAYDCARRALGTIYNATWRYLPLGMSCLDMDNFSKYVSFDMDYSPWLNITGELTLAARVSIRDNAWLYNQGVVAKWLSTGNKRSYALYIDYQTHSAPYLGMGISPDGTGAASKAIHGGTQLTVDTEYNVLGVFIPSVGIYVYVNGVLDGTLAAAVPASAYNSGTSADFWIGAQYLATENYILDGRISNVQVWNRALTPEEIYDLHRRPFGTAAFPRLLYPGQCLPMVGTGVAGTFWPVLLRLLDQQRRGVG